MMLKTMLVSFILSSTCMLCSCNTTQGLSQDFNQFSDSIHRTVNS
ncbi:MAG: hypothetical protein P4M12_08960 [Gammaproteobacteria bacterium]|nr:hypothetical protein [Gammaproteobacteria bacterium]